MAARKGKKKPEPEPVVETRTTFSRRTSDASSLPNSWRAAIEAAVRLGVPAVIALGLVWLLGMSLQTKMERTADSVAALDKRMGELVAHLNADSAQSWRLIAISQRICINTSKSDQDRISCVTEGPK